MLIRVRGAQEGFANYLEHGQKKGRNMHRDVLDERIPLAGDLNLFEQVVSKIDREGEKYMHFTLAFDGDMVTPETLKAAVKEFVEGFALSAYKNDEYMYYAEAHKPRVLSYTNEATGQFVTRKIHIHIGIPDTNLLTGERLSPFGLVKHNLKYIDAFQEDFNARYGLHSPKDSPRLDGVSLADMLTRYGKQELLGQRHTDLKAAIGAEIVNGEIKDFAALKTRLSEFGTVKVARAEFEGREYLKVTPPGAKQAIRFDKIVFSPLFLSKPPEERRRIVEDRASTKYREAQAAKNAPEHTGPILAAWHSIRARELKHLASDLKNPKGASVFFREQYQPADPATRVKLLDKLDTDYNLMHRSMQNGNEQQRQPHHREHRQSPPPAARGRLRHLSELDVVRLGEGTPVLLPDHVRRIVDERQQRQETARAGLRRGSDGEPNRLSPQPSSVVAGLRRDLAEGKQRAAAALEFSEIKAKLDAGRLLAHLAHSHGLNPDKYQVEKAQDGSDRIRAGTRAHTVNDFLTKEMSLPWNEAAPLLKRLYAQQLGRETVAPVRTTPAPAVWALYRAEMDPWKADLAVRRKELISQHKERRNALRERQRAERAELRSKGWKGRRNELIATRSLLATEQLAEREHMAAQLSAERAALSTFPDFSAWCEQQGLQQPKKRQREEDTENAITGLSTKPLAAHDIRRFEARADFAAGVVRYHAANGNLAFTDTGPRINLAVLDDDTVLAVLKLGQTKFGRVELHGNAAFKAQCVRLAARHGIALADKELAAQVQAIREEARAKSVPMRSSVISPPASVEPSSLTYTDLRRELEESGHNVLPTGDHLITYRGTIDAQRGEFIVQRAGKTARYIHKRDELGAAGHGIEVGQKLTIRYAKDGKVSVQVQTDKPRGPRGIGQ